MQTSSGNTITVGDIGGNKRTSVSDEDVLQCIKDLANWFKTHASPYYASSLEPQTTGASAEEVKSVLGDLGAGESHLGTSLMKFNGGLQYEDTFMGLKLYQIKEISEGLGLKSKNLVPFAKDCDDSLLCLSVENG